MDYMFSNGSQPSFSAPTQPSNQSQPQASFAYNHNQFTNGSTMSMPNAMHPGNLHQAQAQAQAQARATQQSPYSNAPFAQGLASPAHPQFHHANIHAQHAQRQTASPSNVPSSYATPTSQQRSPSVPSNTQPSNMAQTPIKTEHQPQQLQQQPQTPVSPAASQAREQERITTLLDINLMLINEVNELHLQGKTGQIGPDVKSEPDKPTSSLEYRDCMRRLQANLAFLAQCAERNTKPTSLPGPAIMTIPTSPDELVKLYLKLQILFPGWKGAQQGNTQAAQALKASPGPQQQQQQPQPRINSLSSQGSMQNINTSMAGAGMGMGLQPPNSAGLPTNMNMGMGMGMGMQQLPGSAGLAPNMQNLPLGSNAGMSMGMNMMGNMQHMQ